MLKELPLNEPLTCPQCNGRKVVDSAEVEQASYWSGVNMGSYYGALRLARQHGRLTDPCPCCKGTGTKTFTTLSDRLLVILDEVGKGKMVEVKKAPRELAGDEWSYLLAHPDVVCHKLGYSSDYWLYLRGTR